RHTYTYSTGHSPVVTEPTTTPALISLSMGERTGSRVFQWVWPYVRFGGSKAVCQGASDVKQSSVHW
ncbi:hypothetical protein K456DRAFT_1823309, partial [Colletotrichum gloeosporioides 23]